MNIEQFATWCILPCCHLVALWSLLNMGTFMTSGQDSDLLNEIWGRTEHLWRVAQTLSSMASNSKWPTSCGFFGGIGPRGFFVCLTLLHVYIKFHSCTSNWFWRLRNLNILETPCSHFSNSRSKIVVILKHWYSQQRHGKSVWCTVTILKSSHEQSVGVCPTKI